MTGGKFPTGTDPNGDNASGGTMRYISDDPSMGAPSTGTWYKDDWFPQNAGFALTMRNGVSTVYDNNGLEDDSYGNYYDAQAQGTSNANTPGLYRGYSMANNYDWIYASYFKLDQETTFDTLIGYFDWNGGAADPVAFNPSSPSIAFRMNIWSKTSTDNCQQDGVGCMPVNTGGFVGDVFTTDGAGGAFATSLTNDVRRFSDGSTDPIGRLVWTGGPVTLAAGEYFFSHDASVVPEPSSLLLLVGGLLVCARRLRSRTRERR